MKIALQRCLEIGGIVFILAIMSAVGSVAAEEPRPAWTTSKLKGTPDPPAPYAIRPAFPKLKFNKPTSLEELPGRRMIVTEIGGDVYTFLKHNRQIEQKDLLLKIDGSALWHATAHPNFKSNRLLFVCYSRQGTTHVSRFQINDDSPPIADPNSEIILLTWPAGGHNAGCLGFGTDGMLYIATGDGSGPNPPDGRTAGQDVSNLFGCVLRIDVDHQDEGRNYAVPADNPFVDLNGARPEIWSYGLRNPWKFGIDPKTGNIFAADNGWESWEMVHQIVSGGNSGWPIMEGRAILRSEVKRGPTPIRPPVKDHSHSEANSVIGGPVYRGTKMPDLDGTFVYGDYITGTIWGLKSDGKDMFTHRTLVDTDQRITAFAQGSSGELFVLDYDYTGQIYELVPSGLEDLSADFPRRLSETGLFESLQEMSPAAGVIPYEVNVQRWIDGATSHRWIAIPGTASIKFGDKNHSAVFPDGTVIVKHLTLPEADSTKSPLPLETQILHYENGTWHPYCYLWDDNQQDALLVDAAGTDRELKYSVRTSNQVIETTARTWHASSHNECRMCHNAGSGFVLGFEPNQLNRSFTINGQDREQLQSLSDQKVISAVPRLSADDPARLVDPHDESSSLDDRARSYLHGNCASCHHPGGNAIVSFYLRRDMPFEELKTNKGTGIGTFGIENSKLIVPGDPYRSILLYRMSKLGYARMPYIGSQVVDSKGVALIEKWIRSMPHTESEEDSAPIQKKSPDNSALATLTNNDSDLNREQAAAQLLKSTEGAMALAIAIHDERVHDVDRRLRQGYASGSSDIRGLYATFIPEASRRQTLGRNIDPETILSLKGDIDRGRLIFFSDGARCASCHHVDDASRSTGSTLTDIRNKYKLRSEILQHVLQPSLKIDDKFAMWVVTMHSGKSYNGLLISQSDEEVVLKTADGKTFRIAKSEIEEMERSSQSLMPAGVLSDLTAQEAADLLAWLGRS